MEFEKPGMGSNQFDHLFQHIQFSENLNYETLNK